MPYKLRKAPKKDLYWVVTIETGEKHSKLPISREKAQAQMRVLESALEGKAKPITIPKVDFVKEHKNLLKVLASKDPKKLKAEAKDQAKELKKVLKGGVTLQQINEIKNQLGKDKYKIFSRWELSPTNEFIYFTIPPDDGFGIMDAHLKYYMTESEYNTMQKSPEYINFREFSRARNIQELFRYGRKILYPEYIREYEKYHKLSVELTLRKDLIELIRDFFTFTSPKAWIKLEESILGPGIEKVDDLVSYSTYPNIAGFKFERVRPTYNLGYTLASNKPDVRKEFRPNPIPPAPIRRASGKSSSCKPPSPDRSSGRASVFALTCIDPRYAFDVAYMLNHKKELHADYDLFTSAGASVGAQKKEWTKAFFDNLALGIQLHGVSEVWCFDHLDCGMYKATFGLKDDMDPKIHIIEMDKLQKLVKKKHPSLKFRKFIVQPNGDIEEVGRMRGGVTAKERQDYEKRNFPEVYKLRTLGKKENLRDEIAKLIRIKDASDIEKVKELIRLGEPENLQRFYEFQLPKYRELLERLNTNISKFESGKSIMEKVCDSLTCKKKIPLIEVINKDFIELYLLTSGTTRPERPKQMIENPLAVIRQPPPAPAPEPTQWRQKSDETGDVWYENIDTGESSWVVPPGGILVAPQPAPEPEPEPALAPAPPSNFISDKIQQLIVELPKETKEKVKEFRNMFLSIPIPGVIDGKVKFYYDPSYINEVIGLIQPLFGYGQNPIQMLKDLRVSYYSVLEQIVASAIQKPKKIEDLEKFLLDKFPKFTEYKEERKRRDPTMPENKIREIIEFLEENITFQIINLLRDPNWIGDGGRKKRCKCKKGGTRFNMKYDKTSKKYQLLQKGQVMFEDYNKKAVEDLFNDLWKMEKQDQKDKEESERRQMEKEDRPKSVAFRRVKKI